MRHGLRHGIADIFCDSVTRDVADEDISVSNDQLAQSTEQHYDNIFFFITEYSEESPEIGLQAQIQGRCST